MMSCVKNFLILLLINTALEVNGDSLSKGYKHKGAARISCGPRELYEKDGRYYCYTVSETILNEYERQFGKEERLKLNDQESYDKLIETIENNSFCYENPDELLTLLFPDNFEKYLAVGRVVQRLSGVSSHCDYMAKVRGNLITAHKIETKIQELLDSGICKKLKLNAQIRKKYKDSDKLFKMEKIFRKLGYCGFEEPLTKKICRRLFGILWLPCAIAHFFGADVLNN